MINKENGITLLPCPNKLRDDFYNYYINDPEFQSVDAVLCTHAASMCELFMPFNKSLIIVVSTRFEIGRHAADRWSEWIDNLRRIASNPYNTIAANNYYDLEYVRYFTGINNIQYLPNHCGYVKASYQPSRREILIAPARGVHAQVLDSFIQMTKSINSSLAIARIRDLYPHFKYEDLAAHRAIILLPYQISFMSFFEYYRMHIPLFAPTPELLTGIRNI